jgi:hypothetical protein
MLSYHSRNSSKQRNICSLSHKWERVRERVLFLARSPSPAPAGYPLPPLEEGKFSVFEAIKINALTAFPG